MQLVYEGNILLSNRKISMADEYFLPRRKAWICRAASVAFLFAAACSASGIVVAAFVPETIAFAERMGWDVTSRPVQVLSLKEQAQVNATPENRLTFEVYLERPIVRMGMAGIAAAERIPFVVLLFGVGLALRRLGQGRVDPLGTALPWLRRASIAAIVWALVVPFVDSLFIMLLYPGTPAGPHWSITLDVQSIGTALMLGVAAYAAVWALEAGLQAQRELAEIV